VDRVVAAISGFTRSASVWVSVISACRSFYGLLGIPAEYLVYSEGPAGHVAPMTLPVSPFRPEPTPELAEV
jgi:hypothetical protein